MGKIWLMAGSGLATDLHLTCGSAATKSQDPVCRELVVLAAVLCQVGRHVLAPSWPCPQLTLSPAPHAESSIGCMLAVAMDSACRLSLGIGVTARDHSRCNSITCRPRRMP